MKKIVLITSLLIGSNMAYADGQSHDRDMSKMEQSNIEMSQEKMQKQGGEGKSIEHKHKGRHSPISTKEGHSMDDTDDQSHDHDMSKMKHSDAEMTQQQMQNEDSEHKGVTHKHKGKNSPIETKEDHNMDEMKMDNAEKMHDHMKMK